MSQQMSQHIQKTQQLLDKMNGCDTFTCCIYIGRSLRRVAAPCLSLGNTRCRSFPRAYALELVRFRIYQKRSKEYSNKIRNIT